MELKAFEMRLMFIFANVDPTQGTMASSQKGKFDSVKRWRNQPSLEYQINKWCNDFVSFVKYAKIRFKSCTTH